MYQFKYFFIEILSLFKKKQKVVSGFQTKATKYVAIKNYNNKIFC